MAGPNISEYVFPIKTPLYYSLRYAQFDGIPCFAMRTGEHEAYIYTTSYEPICVVDNEIMAHLVLLGDAAIADAQNLLDTLHGGPVGICMSRCDSQEAR